MDVTQRHVLSNAHQDAEGLQVAAEGCSVLGTIDQHLQQTLLVVVGLSVAFLPGHRWHLQEQTDQGCHQPGDGVHGDDDAVRGS